MARTHLVSPLRTAAERTPEDMAVAERQHRWREQWLGFPTVRANHEGGFDFWAVPADTGVYQDDWPRGERLARDTIAHMQRFPEGSAVLRRILRAMDFESTLAQGFVNHLEEALAHPNLYFEPTAPEDPEGRQ